MDETGVGRLRGDLFGEGIDGRFVAEIDPACGESLARIQILQLGDRGRRVGIRRAIGESDVVARLREPAHDGGAETAASAGDERAYFLRVRHHDGSCDITSETFWPPKPNELDRA